MDVQALVESLSENAQDQGADVQASGGCAPLQVQPMALRSCINNLMDNALRYAGHALIALEDQRDQVVIRVIDHGPGIAADKREAVFEPRSEEHTSELQPLMRISYAVFCLKKTKSH